jgi:hypothetical protein
MLLKLEELQDQQIKQTLEPKRKEIIMKEKEKQEALALLKAPDLLERILQDFDKCGVVGEQTNKLVGYLAAVSRKLGNPLAILIQSSSAAGKTWLMEAVLSFVPEEERIKYSSMTGQSLFYMGETNIKNKILAIVEEEGAERTRYALKLLQSEGELSIASTLLHQYQRPLKALKLRRAGAGAGGNSGNEDDLTLCVRVTLDDIEIANRLASKVLGRSLDDLPPQTRRFLELV